MARRGDVHEHQSVAESRTTAPDTTNGYHGYVMPILHFGIPESLVNIAFWTGLATSAAVGVVDPPLAALIGAGVIVGRHRARR